MLRQDSNVDLGAIRLADTGPARKVDLSVAVDGEPGTALGVMSQGELGQVAPTGARLGMLLQRRRARSAK